jgi:monofunctional glycosyltransferase
MRFTTRMEHRLRLRASPTRDDGASDGDPTRDGVTREDVTWERPFATRAALALRQAADWANKQIRRDRSSTNRSSAWTDRSSADRSGTRRTLRPALRGLVIACAALLILPYVLTPLYRVVDPVSTLMLWRWATRARVEHIVQPIGLTGPMLPRTVLAAEDGRFCSHRGIDLAELRVVIKAEARGIRRPRGGSTITQQLAKNLFLWPGHSYVRKALEFPLALWIDLVIPKRRQLEIYLNIAEWGPNGEFGAEAGARRAFGKPASALSAAEAALLTAALPNPVKRDARRPGDGLRRLSATYVGRAAAAADIDRCIRRTR